MFSHEGAAVLAEVEVDDDEPPARPERPMNGSQDLLRVLEVVIRGTDERHVDRIGGQVGRLLRAEDRLHHPLQATLAGLFPDVLQERRCDLHGVDRALRPDLPGERPGEQARPGAEAWLATAHERGRFDDIARRCAAGALLLEAVGPVTARPLEAAGLAVSFPDRWRLGALVRELVKHYGDERWSTSTRAGMLTVRATTAVLDGKPLPLSPSGFAILRALAAANGSVVTREQLSTVMPSGQGGAHAVEAAINRLREAAQARALVKTVVKRGYALAVAA